MISRAGRCPAPTQAWLSDNTGSPSTRFRQSAQPYRLPNGADIASSYADLVAGPGVDTALDRTELNGQLGASQFAWTNTRPDGTPGGSEPFVLRSCPSYPNNHHCANWGSTAGNGDVGEVDQTTCDWTARTIGVCSVATPTTSTASSSGDGAARLTRPALRRIGGAMEGRRVAVVPGPPSDHPRHDAGRASP